MKTKPIGRGKEQKEHNTDSPQCWCNPEYKYVPESDSWIVIHNPESKRN